jgi:hypothetical protein
VFISISITEEAVVVLCALCGEPLKTADIRIFGCGAGSGQGEELSGAYPHTPFAPHCPHSIHMGHPPKVDIVWSD